MNIMVIWRQKLMDSLHRNTPKSKQLNHMYSIPIGHAVWSTVIRNAYTTVAQRCIFNSQLLCIFGPTFTINFQCADYNRSGRNIHSPI